MNSENFLREKKDKQIKNCAKSSLKRLMLYFICQTTKFKANFLEDKYVFKNQPDQENFKVSVYLVLTIFRKDWPIVPIIV